MGETALRTAATGTSAANVTSMAPPVPPPRADGPSQRTIGTVSSASSPPPIRRPTTRRRGFVRSATQPPIAAPTEIPSNTAPMIDVVVSSVRPTYGASRRTARISKTRTDPAATKTIAAAHTAGRGGMAASASFLSGFARVRDVFMLIP